MNERRQLCALCISVVNSFNLARNTMTIVRRGHTQMTMTSRRDFLKLATAASVAAVALRDAIPLAAYPLGLPLGLQLYSLRELLPKDFDGTLKAIAAAGYTEVEAAGYYAMSASDFKQSMTTAGLNCVSGHYPLSMLQPQLESVLAYEGVGSAVCCVLIAVASGSF